MFKGSIVSVSSGCAVSVFILAIAFSGCASTQMKTHNDQTEVRITNLEKDLQAKDAQIVDLQYQVKDLSSKIDTAKPAEPDQASSASTDSAAAVESVKIPEVFGNSPIIRVKVSPEKIQRALKSAGVYTGPVDGKIGPGTKEAVIEFQKSHGLKADVVLGKKTWEALKAYLK